MHISFFQKERGTKMKKGEYRHRNKLDFNEEGILLLVLLS
jgi:hypothetical protein